MMKVKYFLCYWVTGDVIMVEEYPVIVARVLNPNVQSGDIYFTFIVCVGIAKQFTL